MTDIVFIEVSVMLMSYKLHLPQTFSLLSMGDG